MTEIEDLAAELRALREEMVASRTPPSNTVTRTEYEATPYHERAGLLRGKTMIDGPPAPPTPRPPGSLSRAEFDRLSPVEKIKTAKTRTIAD
jgi:hypothetical protein